MATTEHFYTGNNSTTSYAFTFPYYKTSDIKVTWDDVAKTESTHYNVTGTNIVFTGGNTPGNGVAIHIYRETDVDTSKATFAAGSSIRATDLNNNETQLLYAAQEQQSSLIKTAGIKDGAVTTAKIADGTIATADIADNAINAAKIAADAVGASEIAADAVGASELANNAVDTAAIADDAVTSAKIGTGQVIADSIGTNAVTTAKLNNTSVTADKLASNSVITAKIDTGAVTAAKIGTDAVTTVKILDNNITTAKIGDNQVTADKMADNSVDSEHYVDGSIDTAHIGDSQVTSDKIVNNAITNAKMADDSVGTAEIQNNAVTTAKLADAELTTLAGMQSGTASILASGTALTSTTAELNLLDGKSVVTAVSGSSTDVQLPTAKAVNDQIVNLLNEAGGFVPIANEVSFPNANPDPNDGAGTIVSIADAGGVVVNGSGVSTTGRTLGGATVTINGIDSSLNSSTIAAGKGMLVQTTSTLNTYTYHRLVVDEAGVATAQSLVSDFNERYRTGSSNPTSSLDDGDLFFNTSSNKMLVYNASDSSWDDVQSVGNYFINTISSYSGTGGNSASFNGSAYRFVLSNAGTYAQQHLVSVNGVIQKPNSGTSQPSEGFAIDGSSIIFSTAPASGSDYFIITIGAAVNIGTPGNNTVSTVTLQNASVTTDKIANDAVTVDKLANSINTEIAANTAKVSLENDSVTGAKIADDAVGAEHIEQLDAALQFADSVQAQFGTHDDLRIYHDNTHGYVSNRKNNLYVSAPNYVQIVSTETDGGTQETSAKFLRNGAVELYYDNSKHFETTAAGSQFVGDVVFDNTHNAGRDLKWDQSADLLVFEDNVKAGFGSSVDLQIFHDTANSYINNSTGSLFLRGDNISLYQMSASEPYITCTANGAVNLYHDNSKKLETSADGITMTGWIYIPDSNGSNNMLRLGNGADLQIYHTGSKSYIKDTGTGSLRINSDDFRVYNAADDENMLKAVENGGVELYYDNVKKLETNSEAVLIHGITRIQGAENTDAILILQADEADDFDDYYKLVAKTNGDFAIENIRNTSSWETNLTCTGDGSVDLYYNGNKRFETTDYGHMLKMDSGHPTIRVHCDTSSSPLASIQLMRGPNDTWGAGGYTDWQITDAAGGVFTLYQGENGNTYTRLNINTSGTVSGDLNDTSDEKKKKNITSISDGAIAKIKQLRPVNFNWKDPLNTADQSGFIAQEVKTVIPDLVVGEEYDETENNMGYAINTAGVVAHLTKALQEAITKIETLETKVAALEAK